MFRRVWLGCGWLWIGIVLWLSLMPQPPQPLTFAFADKLEHTLAYIFLMSWFLVVYRANSRLVCAIGLIAMGVLVEILQGMSGYRYFEYADMVANSSGVLLGWLLMNYAGDSWVARWMNTEQQVTSESS